MTTRDEMKANIKRATNHEGPWEFGVYFERTDGSHQLRAIAPIPTEERAREHIRDNDWGGVQ